MSYKAKPNVFIDSGMAIIVGLRPDIHSCVMFWPEDEVAWQSQFPKRSWGNWRRQRPNPRAKTWHKIWMTGLNPNYNPNSLNPAPNSKILRENSVNLTVQLVISAILVLPLPLGEQPLRRKNNKTNVLVRYLSSLLLTMFLNSLNRW